MMYDLDTARLAAMVRAKQGTRGLRAAAYEITSNVGSMSISTLSRLMNDQMPDMVTFLTLCTWLQVAPSEFFSPTECRSTGEEIAMQIRSDASLEPVAANVLATIVEAAYRELIKNG